MQVVWRRSASVLHKVVACHYILCLSYNVKNDWLAIVISIRPLHRHRSEVKLGSRKIDSWSLSERTTPKFIFLGLSSARNASVMPRIGSFGACSTLPNHVCARAEAEKLRF